MSTYVNHTATAYPSPIGPMVVLSVLTTAIDGYRVYQGIVPDTSVADDYAISREWVQRHGNKASAKDAVKLFNIEIEEYAR